jgi:hypothetical protein
MLSDSPIPPPSPQPRKPKIKLIGYDEKGHPRYVESQPQRILDSV